MSEDKKYYGEGPEPKIKPGCLEKYGSPNYEPPDYEQLAALKVLSGLTGSRLATMAGVDTRSFRKWLAPPEASNSRQIPYSAWRLLLIETKIVNQWDCYD